MYFLEIWLMACTKIRPLKNITSHTREDGRKYSANAAPGNLEDGHRGIQSILREVYPRSSRDGSTRNVYDTAERPLHLHRTDLSFTLSGSEGIIRRTL